MNEHESSEKIRHHSGRLRPEMVVAVAAIILSLCGLFLAVYETSLIRKQHYASVWPCLIIGFEDGPEGFSLFAMNVGTGPARIEDVRVSYDGKDVSDWAALLEAMKFEGGIPSHFYSTINHMVIPSGARQEILSLKASNFGPDVEASCVLVRWKQLWTKVALDVQYASIYDETWVLFAGDRQPSQGQKEIPSLA